MSVGGTAVAERAWCVVVPHHARGARLARHRLAGELSPVVSAELLADAVEPGTTCVKIGRAHV